MNKRVVATDLMVYNVYWDWTGYGETENLRVCTINDSFETAIEAAKECYERLQKVPLPENFEELLRGTTHEYEDEDILICIRESPIYTRKANFNS